MGKTSHIPPHDGFMDAKWKREIRESFAIFLPEVLAWFAMIQLGTVASEYGGAFSCSLASGINAPGRIRKTQQGVYLDGPISTR
jgi:hypothetical protein